MQNIDECNIRKEKNGIQYKKWLESLKNHTTFDRFVAKIASVDWLR